MRSVTACKERDNPLHAWENITSFSTKMEIGIFVVEWGNTFQFSLLWLILKAMVLIKEMEENQENSSKTVMVTFCLRVVHVA